MFRVCYAAHFGGARTPLLRLLKQNILYVFPQTHEDASLFLKRGHNIGWRSGDKKNTEISFGCGPVPSAFHFSHAELGAGRPPFWRRCNTANLLAHHPAFLETVAVFFQTGVKACPGTLGHAPKLHPAAEWLCL